MLPEPANTMLKSFIVKPNTERSFIDNSSLERIRGFLDRFCSKCDRCGSPKLYLCIDPDCSQRSTLCPQCQVYDLNGGHFFHKFIYMVPLFSDPRREGNQHILYLAVEHLKKQIQMRLQVRDKEFKNYSKALKQKIDILTQSQLTKRFESFNFHFFLKNFRALSSKQSSNLHVSIEPLFYNVKFPNSDQYNKIWYDFALKLIDYCRKLLGEPGTVVPQVSQVYDLIDYLTISLEQKLVEVSLDYESEQICLSTDPNVVYGLRSYHTNNFNYTKCYDYFNTNSNSFLQIIKRGISGPRELILLEREGEFDISANSYLDINTEHIPLKKLEIQAGVVGIIHCLGAIPQNNNIKKLILQLNKQQQYLNQIPSLIKRKLPKIEKLKVVFELSGNLDIQSFLIELMNLKVPLQGLQIEVSHDCRIPNSQMNNILAYFLGLPNFQSLKARGIYFVFNKQLQKAVLQADNLLTLEIDSCPSRKVEHLVIKNALKEYQESVLRKRKQILYKLIKMKKIEGNRPKLSWLRNPYFFYSFLASPYI